MISARIWIKQQNQACEDLLAHWAEPFSVWADELKRDLGPEWKEPLPPTTAHMPFPTSIDSITALVDRAWRYLLENQPHDSICGCSVDGVHEEMRQRYEWVHQVGEEIVRQSLRTIGALGPDHVLGTIAVFNPTPQPATGFVTATVPWRDDEPVVGAVAPDDARSFDVMVGTRPSAAAVEAITRLRDVQAQVRPLQAKLESASGAAALILLVNATHANRRALHEAGEGLRAAFPSGTRAILAALGAGRVPNASGIVLL